jgi:hypothetical protein
MIQSQTNGNSQGEAYLLVESKSTTILESTSKIMSL